MSPFDRLAAFNLGYKVGLSIYRTTESWPKREMYGLASQARKAAFSISLNIAEGCSKRGPKEMRRYLDIALGSLAELEVILRFAKDLEMASNEETDQLEAQRSEASRTTWGLYEVIQRRCLS
jgi:four helix bundle protein